MKKILIILIFLAAIVLRLWKVPEFFSFNFDEEYQANLAWSIVKDFHIIWIGVSASNVGYYLGPGFTYLNAFLFWISKGDPVILGYFASFWGIATMFSIYFIAKDLFSQKAALLASIFYGFSSLLIYFDRRFWNPLPIPFISVWIIYSLIKSQKNPRWLILSIVLIALSFHVHLSLMIFWPLIIFFFIRNIKKIKLSTWIAAIASYLIITSPLIVYDIVHNFDNLLAPVRFLQSSSDPNHTFQISTAMNYLVNTFSTIGRLWFLKWGTNIQEEHNLGAYGGNMTHLNPILSLLSAIILLYVLFIKKGSRYTILSIAMLIPIILFILYPGVAGEYYLLSFMGLFPIAVGLFLEKIPKLVVIPLVIVFIVSNAITIFTTTQEKYGLTVRKELIGKVMETVKNQSFYLETTGTDGRKYHPYGGWRYLFKTYGKTPGSSHADDFFGWIYQDDISKEKPKLRVIIAEEMEPKISNPIIKKFSRGVYNAYVLNN